jgi:hypothetical protein
MGRVDYDPRLWGSAGWTFLEYCARGLDEKSASSFQDFLRLLPQVLPCDSCRVETEAYIQDHPFRGVRPLDWVLSFRASVAARLRSQARAPCHVYACLALVLAAVLVSGAALLRARRLHSGAC